MAAEEDRANNKDSFEWPSGYEEESWVVVLTEVGGVKDKGVDVVGVEEAEPAGVLPAEVVGEEKVVVI